MCLLFNRIKNVNSSGRNTFGTVKVQSAFICTFDEGSLLYQPVKKIKKVHLVAPGTNHVLKDTNWNGTNVFCFY